MFQRAVEYALYALFIIVSGFVALVSVYLTLWVLVMLSGGLNG